MNNFRVEIRTMCVVVISKSKQIALCPRMRESWFFATNGFPIKIWQGLEMRF